MFTFDVLTDFAVASNTASFLAQMPIEITNLAGQNLISLGKAVLVLILGWIVAGIVKGSVKNLLKKTDLDNQLAAKVLGDSAGKSFPIESWVGEFAYWIILLFTLVAFFNALELEAVSVPLNGLLQQITTFLPKILGAGILIGLAWAIATLVKLLVTRLLGESGLSQRLGLSTSRETDSETPESDDDSLAETIGNALYWFIFLLFLPAILSTLELEGTLKPVQGLLDQILSILPNILAAVLIGAVGWVIAKIVSQVVTNLADGLGLDSLGERFGIRGGEDRQDLAEILGVVVYVLILIPVAITALDALKIEAISAPATDMLNQVMTLLPKLFAASIVLGVGYVIGQFVSDLVSDLLNSLGFDNLFQWLGFGLDETPEAETEAATPAEDTPFKTPSQIVGIIALVGIMLVAALTAVDILQIEALTTVMGVVLKIAAQVLIGLIVFTFGLYLANLAFKLISSAGTRQSRLLGHTARISVLILVSAMALQQMGIAPNIVNLAFGLLVGGIAVAIALAFGLGGRDVAGEQIREWLKAFNEADD